VGADELHARWCEHFDARLEALEILVHRLLLIVGAAGTMLAEFRRDEGDE
jgi:hypothetical protein